LPGLAEGPPTRRKRDATALVRWCRRGIWGPPVLLCSADDIDRKSSCRAFSPQVAEWRLGFRSWIWEPHARGGGRCGCSMNSAGTGSQLWRSQGRSPHRTKRVQGHQPWPL